MSDPAQPAERDQPEQPSQNELHQRGENTALNQLAQARDEKTHQGGDDITRRTLTHNYLEFWKVFRDE